MQLEKITLSAKSIGNYAELRNAAIAHSKADWILFVDRDETVSRKLEEEIRRAINHPEFTAYYTPRVDVFLGRTLRHGETGGAQFIRLARRDFGKWVRPVHEVWIGHGKVGQLKNPLIHLAHPTISSFLSKIDHYSSLDAEYRFDQGVKSSLWKIALYPIAKFKVNYFLKLGFLDGVPGLIMAIMMSFHSYLTWTKLYLLWHKK